MAIIGCLACSDNSTDSQKISAAINGNIKGLNGTLVLQINKGEKFTVESNGSFEFKTLLSSNSNYEIRVVEEPCAQRCDLDHTVGKISDDGTIALNISCGVKKWEFPVSISDFVSFPNFNVESPALDMNDYGDILLAWTQVGDLGDARVYKKEFINRTWVDPLDIFDFINPPQTTATGISAAIDRDENAYVTWIQTKNLNESKYDQVYMARKLNNIWVYPSIEDSVSISYSNVYRERDPGTIVKVNKNGDGVMVWAQIDGEELYSDIRKLYVAELKNGVWNFPKDLTETLNLHGLNTATPAFDVALNDRGDIIVAWVQYIDNEVYIAEKINGVWKSSKKLSLPGQATNSHVNMNNLGNAIVVWDSISADKGGFDKIYKAERDTNFNWTGPKNSSDYITVTGDYSGTPDVAINDEGRSLIVWREWNESGTIDFQIYKMEGYQGVWNTNDKKKLSFSEIYADRPVVEMDNQNNAIVTWRQLTESGDEYYLFKSQSNDVRNSKWAYPLSFADHISPGSSSIGKFSTVAKNCRMAIAWTQLDSQNKNYQVFLSTYR